MYGIPEDFDLSPIVGQMIERVDLGPYIMHINFGNGWKISCEAVVDVLDGNKAIRVRDHQNWCNLEALKPLLGAVVKGWKVESKKSFSIQLENSFSIIFVDDSSEFESFQIDPKGWII